MPTPSLGNLMTGDIVEVVFEGRLFEQTILNVFHYICETPADPAIDRWEAYELLVGRLTAANALRDDMLKCLSDDYGLESIRTQFIIPDRLLYRRFAQTVGGSVALPAANANSAVSVERRANTAGRRGIGRVQLAGICKDHMSEGYVTPAFLALAGDFEEEIPAGIATVAPVTTWFPVLFGRTPNEPPYYHSYPVVEADVKATIRTMHRRTVGLGI